MAILDKSRQLLVVLYQRCPKKMSKNAERPASSRPRIGREGAADRNEREFRPRIRIEGAADRNEREFPAASPPPLNKKAGPIRIRLLVDLT